MKLIKKQFKMGYDKKIFYSIMGEYFAEKKYRSEMPYLKNDDKKSWVIYYYDEELVSFYAYENKNEIYDISGFYVVDKYRNAGVTKQMMREMMKEFSAIRLTSNSVYFLKTLKDLGFEETAKRGNYKIVEWGERNGTKGAD